MIFAQIRKGQKVKCMYTDFSGFGFVVSSTFNYLFFIVSIITKTKLSGPIIPAERWL